MLSEGSQSQKTTCCIIPLYEVSTTFESIESWSRWVFSEGWEKESRGVIATGCETSLGDDEKGAKLIVVWLHSSVHKLKTTECYILNMSHMVHE